MKFYLSILSFFVTIINLNAQTGSAEISSGGFSFIPAFTSKEPNLIINAETNSKYKLTGQLVYMVRLKSFTPNGVILISRYKLIDKKFKAIVGIHLPALQVSEKYDVTSLFGQELFLSYPVSKKITLSTFFLHGAARNSDFKATFAAFNVNYQSNKWNFMSQTYYLDLGNSIGIDESISYDINEHFQIKGFANYTITDQFFISTIGVKYKI
jgi:hypothetical protein